MPRSLGVSCRFCAMRHPTKYRHGRQRGQKKKRLQTKSPLSHIRALIASGECPPHPRVSCLVLCGLFPRQSPVSIKTVIAGFRSCNSFRSRSAKRPPPGAPSGSPGPALGGASRASQVHGSRPPPKPGRSSAAPVLFQANCAVELTTCWTDLVQFSYTGAPEAGNATRSPSCLTQRARSGP